MKGFALFLLCALFAVQARHTGVVKSTGVAAALGENPWVVKLNIAVSTSGLLEYCGGTLIDNLWVLTAASCVRDARFIWVRYGVVDAISPELVTENSVVRINPGYNAETGENNLALISINRFVETSGNIAPAGIAASGSEASGKFCGFGADEDGNAGEILKCSEVTALEELSATPFDIGAALINDGRVVGILSKVEPVELSSAGDALEWLKSETGIDFNPDAVEGEEESSEEAGEDNDSEDADPDNLVHFIN